MCIVYNIFTLLNARAVFVPRYTTPLTDTLGRYAGTKYRQKKGLLQYEFLKFSAHLSKPAHWDFYL